MQWWRGQSGGDWLSEFQAYTPFHAVTVAVCAFAIFVLCRAGRRSRDEGEHRLRVGIGWTIVAFQAFAFIWRLLPGQFDLHESLPLHLCRVTVWAAALAMLTESRRARSICFFWGLGLSTQGFITPMWTQGLASVEFWMFWVSHAQIAGVAAYSVAVLGYRPSRGDLLFVSVSGVLLASLVIGVNLSLGTNYSYLGAGAYDARCIVDLLGPWPWRAPAMIAGSLAIFGLLYGLSVALRWLARLARRLPQVVRGFEVA